MSKSIHNLMVTVAVNDKGEVTKLVQVFAAGEKGFEEVALGEAKTPPPVNSQKPHPPKNELNHPETGSSATYYRLQAANKRLQNVYDYARRMTATPEDKKQFLTGKERAVSEQGRKLGAKSPTVLNTPATNIPVVSPLHEENPPPSESTEPQPKRRTHAGGGTRRRRASTSSRYTSRRLLQDMRAKRRANFMF
jgi:hypothetical protein